MNCELLVLREVYENSKVSQRAISKALDISLGKTNAIINKLVEKKYLEKTEDYIITKKGKEAIEKYKVDNALILASGLGMRLAPLTFDTPKPFIKIKGESMIERQIMQLKEAGINDITIMVGYLKEKFDFLIDKYDVKLLYNPEYKDKNTIATLYHAREVLKNKNTYVCVADVYMEQSIFHKYEFEPYYCAEFLDDVKNEWQFIVNSKKEILGVMEGGKDAYCMMGPAFFTKEFSKKLIVLLESYYKSGQADNFYWEDVYVRNIDVLPPMFAYYQQKYSMHEFDSLADIRKYDVSYNDSGSFQFNFVANVFGVKESDIIDILCINDGMTNSSYKFKIKNDKKHTYICRVPGQNTNEFINRKNEHNVYKLLKNKDITEELIAFDDDTGYKIAVFYEDSKTIDITNESELKKSMYAYKKLHSMEIVAKIESNDIIVMIERYMDIIKKNHIKINFTDFDMIYDEAYEVVNYVRKYKRPYVLTSGDANPNNVLLTKDGIKLIDFEYAGLSDPLSDVALFASFIDFDIAGIKKLSKYYFEAPMSNDFILKNIDENIFYNLILCYTALSSFYNVVWTICRQALSDVDYGYYGMRKYRIFKNIYKYLKETKVI